MATEDRGFASMDRKRQRDIASKGGKAAHKKGAAHESAAVVIVDNPAPQTVVHENRNAAVAEITPDEEAAVLATVAAVLARLEPQPATVDDNVTRPEGEDDDSAAKRAILHEWENWSALHSDELDDPNVGEYFFRHLQANKPKLLIFSSQDKQGIVRSALGHLR